MADAPRRILLVEDDESNRITTAALLEDEGFEVVVATSVAEAEAALRGPPPDVALLDGQLGDEDGLSLVPAIRAASPGARILLVSGAAAPGAAVDGAVEKGDGFAALLAAIEAQLGR